MQQVTTINNSGIGTAFAVAAVAMIVRRLLFTRLHSAFCCYCCYCCTRCLARPNVCFMQHTIVPCTVNVCAIMPHCVRAPAPKIKLNDNNLSPKCFNLNVRQRTKSTERHRRRCVCNKKITSFCLNAKECLFKEQTFCATPLTPPLTPLLLVQFVLLPYTTCLTFMVFLTAALKLCVVLPLWWLLATAFKCLLLLLLLFLLCIARFVHMRRGWTFVHVVHVVD